MVAIRVDAAKVDAWASLEVVGDAQIGRGVQTMAAEHWQATFNWRGHPVASCVLFGALHIYFYNVTVV